MASFRMLSTCWNARTALSVHPKFVTSDDEDTRDHERRANQNERIGFERGEEILQDDGEENVGRLNDGHDRWVLAFDRLLRENHGKQLQNADDRSEEKISRENSTSEIGMLKSRLGE